MRLSEEQALQDDNRFANYNALAELKYCGWEIPHRKAITNDNIRFYAWLCRSAVAMLNEQEPAKPVIDTYFYRCAKCGCALCGRTITAPDNNRLRPNYCSECGQEVNWQL